MFAVVGASLLLAAAGSPRGIKEGGTFRVAVLAGFFNTIDPALVSLFTEGFVTEPACGTLMRLSRTTGPRRGSRSLRSWRPITGRFQGRTHLHVHDPQGRALLGRQARDGARLRARD